MSVKAETRGRRRMSAMRRNESIAGYLFMLPLLLGIVFLTYGQFVYSLIISFTDKSIFAGAKFVGFRNYAKLLTEDFFFWKSIKATIFYAFGSVIATQLAALAIAVLLNNKYLKGKAFFRTIFYIPSIVPAVASCLLWMWMFNPDFGLFNAVLKALGLPTSKWIYAESSAVPSLILMSAWACGAPMVIYLSGLANVPPTLLEAVDIDGGGAWTKFIHITLPMISPVLFYNTLMGIIGGFMTFTNSYVMTEGGPNNATLFVNYLIYRDAFQYNEFGYASALAWIVFLVLAVCTLVIFRFFGRKVYYGDADK
ncbi:MAG: sugar ABC transporter permease [Clostridia bacterium]|nr:sugar ABC transporter permease [Clostridia bacterium]